MKGIQKAIGSLLETIVKMLLTYGQSEAELLPDRAGEWLITHGFTKRGTETGQVPDPDYMGFVSWLRNGIFALLGWTVLFELYATVLGHASANPDIFGRALIGGIILFLGTWTFWLFKVPGRVSKPLAYVMLAFSFVCTAILIGGPCIELLMPSQPLTELWSKPELYGPALTYVASGWALLGYVLMAMFLAPLFYMGLMGPFVLAQVISATPHVAKEAWKLLGIASSKNISESLAAKEELIKRTTVQVGLLKKLLAGMALFCITIAVNPTVAGLGMGIAIAMASAIVIWIRDANQFRGYALTKVIYAVASCAVIGLSVYYGVNLSLRAGLAAWAYGWVSFTSFVIAMITVLVSGVLIAATSTTNSEYAELRSGDVDIKSYKLEFSHFDEHGKPVFKKLSVLAAAKAEAEHHDGEHHDKEHAAASAHKGFASDVMSVFRKGWWALVGLVCLAIIVIVGGFLAGIVFNIDFASMYHTDVIQALTDNSTPTYIRNNVLLGVLALGAFIAFGFAAITEKKGE